ncbi:hypothetical protein ACGFMM_26485 [Streptomyces sp. NPDC048604]|uniref:hypothetical protein n=1 Tax=Streptomyces sp. NPDC048604 TaxID=3365578 RepID=UPI00372215DB
MRKSLAVAGASALLALGSTVAMAPTAQAGSGQATAVAQSAQGQVKAGTGVAKSLDKSAGAPAAAQGDISAQANCWNGRTSGRNFYMTCSGSGYRVYVDCSNGRYTFGTYYYGTWNHTLTCPSGTYAIWGGSIGG